MTESLESRELELVPFLTGSFFFLKGKGTLILDATGLGGREADRAGRVGEGSTSSSSPSSGDEVAGLFEAGSPSGDVEAWRFAGVPTMSWSDKSHYRGEEREMSS